MFLLYSAVLQTFILKYFHKIAQKERFFFKKMNITFIDKVKKLKKLTQNGQRNNRLKLKITTTQFVAQVKNHLHRMLSIVNLKEQRKDERQQLKPWNKKK